MGNEKSSIAGLVQAALTTDCGLTDTELILLAAFREISDTDRGYIMRVIEALFKTQK